jgi:8-oxo-dGTP pyrophosphatase MutT (NUDIX family)
VLSPRDALAGRLDPEGRHRPEPGLARAAVLVPIVEEPEPALLLTRRADTLRLHAGHLSFPGGREEEGDAGPVQAALREAEEEIGLDRAHVEVLGALDAVRSRTQGISVVPVVGLLARRPELEPRAAEVAAIVELPLAEVLATEPREIDWTAGDTTVRTYVYDRADGDDVVGLTARIVKHLAERLREGAAR